MDGFVHLHVHSHYSLLDGANRISDLVHTAKHLGMDSLALTDHGNLFGAVEFYSVAKAAGIKPILGMEAYISPTVRQDRSIRRQSRAAYHLLLLAMNETGWRNLVKLSSRAYLEGFYYKPRVDRELLAEFNEGLICTTACLSGEVPAALLANQEDSANRIAGEYLEIFGKDRFFIEVQQQGLADQDRANVLLVDLANRLGVGLVGTNDVHFLKRQDKLAHEVLTCISTGRTLADTGRMVYPPELFLKSPAEMREALSAWPEAADNTLRIAEACNVELDFSAKHLPAFECPDGRTPQQYLCSLANKGLKERFGETITEAHRRRLDHELKTIEAKGYSSYVLIVHDLTQYARRNNIPAAPRGSACATLLGYCLGIGNIDPMRYGLLFERWTDIERREDPDIDIDICQEGRGDVIRYVREKYGHVAQIITYGTLKARAAIRDVGRVMGIPLPEIDALAKKIPEGPKVTLSSALSSEPELKRLAEASDQTRQLFAHALALEGLARHAGVHAAGVIIATEPLENIIPLCKQANSDDPITQWPGPTCDKIGLMKMDFLGLRTLTIVERARQLAKQRTGKDIDPEELPLDDEKVFELFRNGQTDGVFQFESDGMKNVLMQMRPQRIEDLIAANAMYRPGPMELIPTYCARSNGAEAVPSIHPLVDEILAETYGIMVYQEQIMQVLNRLGKIPLSRALTLIKAISKKKQDTIKAEKPNFLTGAEENGIAHDESEQLFDLILKFAGYGFNKAHSTRYAIVAYQTAYFKVHCPAEFLAATLTFESGDTDKVMKYISTAGSMGIKIAPPNINTCGSDFTVDGHTVRFGLAAVKGVGSKAVEAIVATRQKCGPFKDLYHFCENVDLRAANRSTIEALIKCGAFDGLSAHRAAMLAALDQAIALGQAAASNRKSGQKSFFDLGQFAEAADTKPQFPDVEPLSETEVLAAEKDALGFYISSHPMVRYGRELTSLGVPKGISLASLADHPEATPVTVGCMVVSIRYTHTRAGNEKMAMLTLEDLTGKCDAVVFPKTFATVSELLHPEALIFIKGTIDRRRERPSIIVDDVIPINQAVEQLVGQIMLTLPAGGTASCLLERTAELLKSNAGNCPVLLKMTPTSRNDICMTIRTGKQWFVTPSTQVVETLEGLFEQENLLLMPKHNGNGRGLAGRNGRRANFGRRASSMQANGPTAGA